MANNFNLKNLSDKDLNAIKIKEDGSYDLSGVSNKGLYDLEGKTDEYYGSTIKDTGVSGLQGVVGLAGSASGLLDTATGGLTRGLTNKTNEWNDSLQSSKSPYLKDLEQQRSKNAEDKNIIEGAGSAIYDTLSNPRLALSTAANMIPNTVGIGMASKAVQAGGKLIGGAAGKALQGTNTALATGAGLVTGGGNVSQIIDENNANNKETDFGDKLYGLGSGALSGAVTGLSGRLADELGVADYNKLGMGRQAAVRQLEDSADKGGILSKALLSTGFEGAQEGVESAIEQAGVNLGTGNDILRGMNDAVGTGIAGGFIMGGGHSGAQAISRISDPDRQSQETVDQRVNSLIDASEAVQLNPQGLPTNNFDTLNEMKDAAFNSGVDYSLNPEYQAAEQEAKLSFDNKVSNVVKKIKGISLNEKTEPIANDIINKLTVEAAKHSPELEAETFSRLTYAKEEARLASNSLNGMTVTSYKQAAQELLNKANKATTPQGKAAFTDQAEQMNKKADLLNSQISVKTIQDLSVKLAEHINNINFKDMTPEQADKYKEDSINIVNDYKKQIDELKSNVIEEDAKAIIDKTKDHLKLINKSHKKYVAKYNEQQKEVQEKAKSDENRLALKKQKEEKTLKEKLEKQSIAEKEKQDKLLAKQEADRVEKELNDEKKKVKEDNLKKAREAKAAKKAENDEKKIIKEENLKKAREAKQVKNGKVELADVENVEEVNNEKTDIEKKVEENISKSNEKLDLLHQMMDEVDNDVNEVEKTDTEQKISKFEEDAQAVKDLLDEEVDDNVDYTNQDTVLSKIEEIERKLYKGEKKSYTYRNDYPGSIADKKKLSLISKKMLSLTKDDSRNFVVIDNEDDLLIERILNPNLYFGYVKIKDNIYKVDINNKGNYFSPYFSNLIRATGLAINSVKEEKKINMLEEIGLKDKYIKDFISNYNFMFEGKNLPKSPKNRTIYNYDEVNRNMLSSKYNDFFMTSNVDEVGGEDDINMYVKRLLSNDSYLRYFYEYEYNESIEPYPDGSAYKKINSMISIDDKLRLAKEILIGEPNPTNIFNYKTFMLNNVIDDVYDLYKSGADFSIVEEKFRETLDILNNPDLGIGWQDRVDFMYHLIYEKLSKDDGNKNYDFSDTVDFFSKIRDQSDESFDDYFGDYLMDVMKNDLTINNMPFYLIIEDLNLKKHVDDFFAGLDNENLLDSKPAQPVKKARRLSIANPSDSNNTSNPNSKESRLLRLSVSQFFNKHRGNFIIGLMEKGKVVLHDKYVERGFYAEPIAYFEDGVIHVFLSNKDGTVNSMEAVQAAIYHELFHNARDLMHKDPMAKKMFEKLDEDYENASKGMGSEIDRKAYKKVLEIQKQALKNGEGFNLELMKDEFAAYKMEYSLRKSINDSDLKVFVKMFISALKRAFNKLLGKDVNSVITDDAMLEVAKNLMNNPNPNSGKRLSVGDNHVENLYEMINKEDSNAVDKNKKYISDADNYSAFLYLLDSNGLIKMRKDEESYNNSDVTMQEEYKAFANTGDIVFYDGEKVNKINFVDMAKQILNKKDDINLFPFTYPPYHSYLMNDDKLLETLNKVITDKDKEELSSLFDDKPVEQTKKKARLSVKEAEDDLLNNDYRGADLSARDFSELNLTGIDLSNADLHGIDFTDSNLSNANLSNTDLSYSLIRNTNFDGVNFTDSTLDFTDSTLDYYWTREISGSFKKAIFKHANLRKANFYSADFVGADFREAMISESSFHRADFVGADFREAVISKTGFFGSDFTDANMYDLDLQELEFKKCVFDKTNLRKANLSISDLKYSRFYEINLSNANLSRSNAEDVYILKSNLSKANLSEADFSDSEIKKSNLTKANLSKADFSNSYIIETDLTGANLEGANFSKTDFRDIIIDDDNLLYLLENNYLERSSLDLKERALALKEKKSLNSLFDDKPAEQTTKKRTRLSVIDNVKTAGIEALANIKEVSGNGKFNRISKINYFVAMRDAIRDFAESHPWAARAFSYGQDMMSMQSNLYGKASKIGSTMFSGSSEFFKSLAIASQHIPPLEYKLRKIVSAMEKAYSTVTRTPYEDVVSKVATHEDMRSVELLVNAVEEGNAFNIDWKMEDAQRYVSKNGGAWSDRVWKAYQEVREISAHNLRSEEISMMANALAPLKSKLDLSEYLKLGDTATALSKTLQEIDRIYDEQLKEVKGDDNRTKKIMDARNSLVVSIKEMHITHQKLIDRGYVPMVRFGDYGFYAKVNEDNDPNKQYYARFQFESPAKAKREYEKYKAEGKLLDPSRLKGLGLKAEADGIIRLAADPHYSPEVLSLDILDNIAGKAELSQADIINIRNEVMKLTLARDNTKLREALKRKAVWGYDRNLSRVLASWTVNVANASAKRVYMPMIKNEIEQINEIHSGDIRGFMDKWLQYINDPREELAPLRALMSVFMLSSPASSFLNMMMNPVNLVPYLYKFGGLVDSVKIYKDSLILAGKDFDSLDARTQKYLEAAALTGRLDAVESATLLIQARGSSASSIVGNELAKAFMSMFSKTEQYNRRTAAIAAGMAYDRLTEQQKKQFAKERACEDNLEHFIRETIDSTQMLMNKGNRAVMARGSVGSLAYTFKPFAIGTISLFNYLRGDYKGKGFSKQQMLMLGLMIAFSGVGGLPFEDDLIDIIESIAARTGNPIQIKKEASELASQYLSESAVNFLSRGIGQYFGVDTSSRTSFGNIIPGTKLFDPYEKDRVFTAMKELFGPIVTLSQNMLVDAPDAVMRGDFRTAFEKVSPALTSNFSKGMRALENGGFTDQYGRFTGEADVYQSILKAIGFSSEEMGQTFTLKSQARKQQQIITGLQKMYSNELYRAIKAGDYEKRLEIYEEMKEHNMNHKDYPINIKSVTTSAANDLKSGGITNAIDNAKLAPKAFFSEYLKQFKKIQDDNE